MSDNGRNSDRRSVLRTGLGLIAVGTAFSQDARAQQIAQEKLAHDLVQYQDTPKDGTQCSKCGQFQAPNGCALVVSPIAPAGWCVAFAPSEG